MVHSIHPRTVQEVKEKADIVDVISEHIVLKKNEANTRLNLFNELNFFSNSAIFIIKKNSFIVKLSRFLFDFDL